MILPVIPDGKGSGQGRASWGRKSDTQLPLTLITERTSQTMVSWSKSSGEMSRSERALTLPANPLSWILHFSPLPSVS